MKTRSYSIGIASQTQTEQLALYADLGKEVATWLVARIELSLYVFRRKKEYKTWPY